MFHSLTRHNTVIIVNQYMYTSTRIGYIWGNMSILPGDSDSPNCQQRPNYDCSMHTDTTVLQQVL